jgi:hypothetical protein
MSTAPATAVATGEPPRLRTKVAAIAVVVALAALAAYTMFSGPTTVSVPAGGGAKAAPAKAAPAGEEGSPEGEGGGGD